MVVQNLLDQSETSVYGFYSFEDIILKSHAKIVLGVNDCELKIIDTYLHHQRIVIQFVNGKFCVFYTIDSLIGRCVFCDQNILFPITSCGNACPRTETKRFSCIVLTVLISTRINRLGIFYFYGINQ